MKLMHIFMLCLSDYEVGGKVNKTNYIFAEYKD